MHCKQVSKISSNCKKQKKRVLKNKGKKINAGITIFNLAGRELEGHASRAIL
jgi:hypothetical protein